jgi:iron complex transport system substrate-binding protein
VKAGHVYPIGWADLCTYRWATAAITDFTAILDTYRKSAR